MVGGRCTRYTADRLFAEEPYEILVTESEAKTPAYQKHEAVCNNSDNSSAGLHRNFVGFLVRYPHQLHNSPQ